MSPHKSAMPFTMERLRRIKPEPKLHRYYDTKAPGLMFAITPNDARTFYYTYASPELMIDSPAGPRKKSRQLALGRFPSLTVEDARKAVSDAAALIAAGVDPMEKRVRTKRERTQQLALEKGLETWTLRHQLDKTVRSSCLHGTWHRAISNSCRHSKDPQCA